MACVGFLTNGHSIYCTCFMPFRTSSSKPYFTQTTCRRKFSQQNLKSTIQMATLEKHKNTEVHKHGLPPANMQFLQHKIFQDQFSLLISTSKKPQSLQAFDKPVRFQWWFHCIRLMHTTSNNFCLIKSRQQYSSWLYILQTIRLVQPISSQRCHSRCSGVDMALVCPAAPRVEPGEAHGNPHRMDTLPSQPTYLTKSWLKELIILTTKIMIGKINLSQFFFSLKPSLCSFYSLYLKYLKKPLQILLFRALRAAGAYLQLWG